MQTTHVRPECIDDDSTWASIAQVSLSEDISDEDICMKLQAGWLYQTMRESGLPQEGFEWLETVIAGTAREARRHFLQGTPNLPVIIRLYCQRMMVDGGLPPGKPRHGGWGYYVIDRMGEIPDESSPQPHRVMELFLYQEGC